VCVWNGGVGCNKVQCERTPERWARLLHSARAVQPQTQHPWGATWRLLWLGALDTLRQPTPCHERAAHARASQPRDWANQLPRQLPRGSGGDASAVKKAGSGRQVGQPIALCLHRTASTRTSPRACMRAILCAGPWCSTTLPHLHPVHVRLSLSAFRVRVYTQMSGIAACCTLPESKQQGNTGGEQTTTPTTTGKARMTGYCREPAAKPALQPAHAPRPWPLLSQLPLRHGRSACHGPRCATA
jgi:hypothetical protein